MDADIGCLSFMSILQFSTATRQILADLSPGG